MVPVFLNRYTITYWRKKYISKLSWFSVSMIFCSSFLLELAVIEFKERFIDPSLSTICIWATRATSFPTFCPTISFRVTRFLIMPCPFAFPFSIVLLFKALFLKLFKHPTGDNKIKIFHLEFLYNHLHLNSWNRVIFSHCYMKISHIYHYRINTCLVLTHRHIVQILICALRNIIKFPNFLFVITKSNVFSSSKERIVNLPPAHNNWCA